MRDILAVPEPEPVPVAIKYTPTWFKLAPMSKKLVVPTKVITYIWPIIKLPAFTDAPCSYAIDAASLTNGGKAAEGILSYVPISAFDESLTTNLYAVP